MGLLKLILAPIMLFTLIFNHHMYTASADTECPIVYTHEDRRTDKNNLRLVQYNVEWLFVDHYSNFDCPGTQCTWKNVSEAEEHLQYVSNVVAGLNPDIINFCEVEGCDELNMVIDNLGSVYKGYLKRGTDTGTGQNVGMITKVDPLINLYRREDKVSYPIVGSKCGFNGTGNAGVSKHYITEFNLGGLNIAFIAAHLIAIPTDPARCAQREGQAQVLQNIVYDYVIKGYEIIVIGDMNDYDNEVLDLNSDLPLSRALDFIKGLDGDKKGLYTLTNVAIRVPQIERYTDWWDSDNNCNTNSIHDYSMIDHVLVTDGIMNKIKEVFVYHGYAEYCGKMNSDHYPVVIDLNL